MARRRKKYPVEFTEYANQDLLAIRERIALDKPGAARKWIREVQRRVGLLGWLPFTGELAPESSQYGLEIRHLILGNYRVFYLVQNERVSIVRIIHSARQVTPPMLGLEPDDASEG